MSARRDDDIEHLLEDLQTTLDRLQGELQDEQRPREPRPPTFGDVLRFTDEYTIPTVIAVLETTIQSLELLRGLLRLMDPTRVAADRERTAQTASARLDDAGRFATDRVSRALSELQRALTEANLPDDPSARSVVTEAQSLSEEIERRLDEARARSESSRRSDSERAASSEPQSAGRERGVQIPVDEAGTDDADGDGADGASVDVESELQSIKDELEESNDETV